MPHGRIASAHEKVEPAGSLGAKLGTFCRQDAFEVVVKANIQILEVLHILGALAAPRSVRGRRMILRISGAGRAVPARQCEPFLNVAVEMNSHPSLFAIFEVAAHVDGHHLRIESASHVFFCQHESAGAPLAPLPLEILAPTELDLDVLRAGVLVTLLAT